MPGKFEGEMQYAESFWGLAMQGFSDDELYSVDNDVYYSVFHLSAEDKAKHGMHESIAYLVLYESEQGFVYCEELTESQYNKWHTTEFGY